MNKKRKKTFITSTLFTMQHLYPIKVSSQYANSPGNRAYCLLLYRTCCFFFTNGLNHSSVLTTVPMEE